MTATVPEFALVPGWQVQRVLTGAERQVVALVEEAYRAHCAGQTINPPSSFLRFPDRPSARIIALAASLPGEIGGRAGVDGVKWISSVPGNVAAGLPRASAVLVLNGRETGYPFACLEASIISATRTAALAASAADWLTRERPRPSRVGFIGTGLIARYVHTYLAGTGWSFDEVGVHDVDPASAAGFRTYVEQSGLRHGEHPPVVVHESAEEVVRRSDLLVFATVATRPHVLDPSWLAHCPLVLHVSLRDLGPEIVLGATNVLDDVEHCLTADTSAHLALQASGDRAFVSGTLGEVMSGGLLPSYDRPVVFSPFGLGVLDLAVGAYVYDRLLESGDLLTVDGFFHDLNRHGHGDPR